MSRGWIAVAAAGAIFAVADVLVSAFWPYPIPTIQVVLHVAVGIAWIGAGLVAWARHPELRIGPLMAAVGIAWYWQDPWWTGALTSTGYYVLHDIALAVGLHAILAFPSGTLQTRLERVLVGAGYATVLIGNLADSLVGDPVREGCSQCGRNLLLVHFDPSLDNVIGVVQAICGAIIGVVTWRCWPGAGVPRQRRAGPCSGLSCGWPSRPLS
jgi:hypothetical protein